MVHTDLVKGWRWLGGCQIWRLSVQWTRVGVGGVRDGA